jgi:hypothetical protein
MISYRNANIFESLKKQMYPLVGGIYICLEDKPWPNPRNRHLAIIEGERYIFSHVRDGKMVLVQKMQGGNVFEVGPGDIKKYFSFLDQGDLRGFKVGDMVVRGDVEVLEVPGRMHEAGRSIPRYKIMAFGLGIRLAPKAYCLREGSGTEEGIGLEYLKWSFAHCDSELLLEQIKKADK